MYNFTPRRPVKSFQDLEVYQKLLAVSVAVAKRVKNQKIIDLALDLPVKIATAHSLRFSDQVKAINTLEDVMLGCNLLIVYLEQYRDIYNQKPTAERPRADVAPEVVNESQRDSCQKAGSNEIGGGTIESEFFEEQIRILLTTRFKVMHLQMSWKKFMKETP